MWSRLAAECPERASGSSARTEPAQAQASAPFVRASGAATATTATIAEEMTAVRVLSSSQTKAVSWER